MFLIMEREGNPEMYALRIDVAFRPTLFYRISYFYYIQYLRSSISTPIEYLVLIQKFS
jgi:hypothetical protein